MFLVIIICFVFKLRNSVTCNSLLPNTVGLPTGGNGRRRFSSTCAVYPPIRHLGGILYDCDTTRKRCDLCFSPRIGWERDHISSPVSRKLSLKSHITGPPSRLADGVNIPCKEDKVSVSQWPRFDLDPLLHDSPWPFSQLSLNFTQLICPQTQI